MEVIASGAFAYQALSRESCFVWERNDFVMELKQRIYFTSGVFFPSLGSNRVFPRISYSHVLVDFGITSIFLAFPQEGALRRQPGLFHSQPARCRLPLSGSPVPCVGTRAQGRQPRSRRVFAHVGTSSQSRGSSGAPCSAERGGRAWDRAALLLPQLI